MSASVKRLVTAPGGQCCGKLTLPGDKSISHRAILLASIAEGQTDIQGFLPSSDCLATVNAMRQLGVSIECTDKAGTGFSVKGVGLHGLTASDAPIDCANAGTLMRLLTGILAGQPFASTLTGDASLTRRPMRRITNPLTQMGAQIQTTAEGKPPINLRACNHFQGIRYALPLASAQVKSCCLLAGLYAKGQTQISESWPTRDHTERLLAYLGYPIDSQLKGEQPYHRVITLTGQQPLTAKPLHVPADISHAAFLLVGACITPGAHITLHDVGVNPTRTGILTILEAMGANIHLSNPRELGGEPVATISAKASALTGIRIEPALVPLAIDEFPAIAIAAAFAKGQTVISGASELRYKESDRISAMVTGINALGGQAKALADGMIIEGKPLVGGSVDAVGDHRIAMAFAMAAVVAEQAIEINHAEAIATSWPSFVDTVAALGMNIGWKE